MTPGVRGLLVTDHHITALDHNPGLLGHSMDDLPTLALIFSCDDFHCVALAHLHGFHRCIVLVHGLSFLLTEPLEPER